MPKEGAGADVKFDSKGAYVDVTEGRMYYLVRSPNFTAHLISLQPEGTGLTLHLPSPSATTASWEINRRKAAVRYSLFAFRFSLFAFRASLSAFRNRMIGRHLSVPSKTLLEISRVVRRFSAASRAAVNKEGL